MYSHTELNELKRMAAEAYVFRDKANEQLQEIQQKTFEARRARVTLLEETKTEVERRKEDVQTKERTLRVILFLSKKSYCYQLESDSNKTMQTLDR